MPIFWKPSARPLALMSAASCCSSAGVGSLTHRTGLVRRVVSIIGPMRGPEERLPGAVYSAAQVRELDRIAIERYGIPGYELMSRAGEAALRVLRTTWPEARRVLVLCGAGNNAGDGYVVARLGHAAGLDIAVVALDANRTPARRCGARRARVPRSRRSDAGVQRGSGVAPRAAPRLSQWTRCSAPARIGRSAASSPRASRR